MLLWIQGELQYFIGVQLDGSDHVEPLRNRLSENTEIQSAKLVGQLSLSNFPFEDVKVLWFRKKYVGNRR
ncbi:unnamed protein product [Triticum turgidum subsp. durum]|uniref:Uncharacterized protein n=1 Tax=Triticum turgidum subsp. durum TaxID=4567 RepID=A0A9R1R7Q2_TRITD|nr:unnamed protein product [Triticum turgidum subsp. durum]